MEPGNLAMPGAPLLTIERDGYRLEASVEESKLASIRVGQPVSVSLDGMDHTFDVRVSEIVPAVDAASRAYTVKIDLPSGADLRSGIFGRARFEAGSRQVLAIPFGAVAERGQLQSVFVADNGTARTRLITLGDKRQHQVEVDQVEVDQMEVDQVEVLSGLSAGEQVIFPVPAGIADGARIEVRR